MAEHGSPIVSIPFHLLPEGETWEIGRVYNVAIVVKEIGKHEGVAEFEIIEATALDLPKSSHNISTNEGVLRG